MNRRRFFGIFLFIIIFMTQVGSVRASDTDTPDSQRPAALTEAIDVAVTNGVATLFARQAAEANETGLILPPRDERRRVGTERVEQRFTRKLVTIPIYETRHAEQLVAVRDEYGTVTGYEKRRVVVERKKVGEREVQREVPDPHGEIYKEVRKPVFEEDGNRVMARGFFGLNGMALYVLCRAGLEDDPRTSTHAEALARLVRQYGAPDHTWDLAWLVAGFAASGSEPELTQTMISKLIDAQMRHRGDEGHGLWGPVAIHYPLLARYLEIELRLRAQISEVEKQLADVPDSAQAARRDGQQALMRLEKVLGEVLFQLAQHTQQGKRLGSVTDVYRPEEGVVMAGLPYYIYNRIALDIESSAAAAMALAVAAEHDLLPGQSQRDQIAGRQLLEPENTTASIHAALAAVSKHQLREGGWTELNLLRPNHAFSKMQPGYLADVPLRGELPRLLIHETVQSHLDGFAAMTYLIRAAPAMATRHREALRSGEASAEAALRRFLAVDPQNPAWPRVYDRPAIPVKELVEAGGQIPPAPEDPSADDSLPFAAFTPPLSSLLHARSLFLPADPSDAAETRRHAELFDALALRLMRMQAEDGQWVTEHQRNVGLTSSELAIMVHDFAQRLISIAQRRERERELSFYQALNRQQSSFRERHIAPDVYPTLICLLLLTEGISGPVTVDDALVIPYPSTPDMAEDEGPADEAGDAAAEAEPMTPQEAVRAIPRPNDALARLLAQRRAPAEVSAEGSDQDAQTSGESTPPPVPEGAPQTDDSGEADTPAEPPPTIDDNLDAILGG